MPNNSDRSNQGNQGQRPSRRDYENNYNDDNRSGYRNRNDMQEDDRGYRNSYEYESRNRNSRRDYEDDYSDFGSEQYRENNRERYASDVRHYENRRPQHLENRYREYEEEYRPMRSQRERDEYRNRNDERYYNSDRSSFNRDYEDDYRPSQNRQEKHYQDDEGFENRNDTNPEKKMEPQKISSNQDSKKSKSKGAKHHGRTLQGTSHGDAQPQVKTDIENKDKKPKTASDKQKKTT